MPPNPITARPSLLAAGRIPAGKPCPWAADCPARMDRCPTPSHPREVAFSCAMARLHDAFDEKIDRPELESTP